ncbi:fructose-bisphosphate aldolase class II [Microbacterium testaceum]|uniref:class II fructose-bisphosphate aldolase n=1 Tax=Microbacterium TaxID=33882 RepID=UPI00277E1709|nr:MULTISPECIES: class II fructose-bisphosphate aldolase [Microbacterium]MDQ1112340.1 fructose-bisphosphate aldolase class II [Microbacterium testaceum]MDR6097122.1 fructose-bisphosphate aldolase class II [Microbacterium sp. SORGH_AS_0454]
MPLAAMPELLAAHRAVGAFNFITLEVAEAIVAGAEAAGSGVILQLSQNAIAFHGGIAPAGAAALRLADAASVPVVVHLDHATDEPLVDEALAVGIRSVMFDAAHLTDAENLERTAAVAARAHAAGAWVEAELGEIGGKGAHAPGVRTDVAEAARFVEATGVDALAVAVGSEHAMRERSALLDETLIAELAAALPVPLVLHGSSGVADAGIDGAVRAGMRKINIGTHLNTVLTAAVRDELERDPDAIDPRRWLAPGRAAVAAEVRRLLDVITGRVVTGVDGTGLDAAGIRA